jgi:hypothetical protein
MGHVDPRLQPSGKLEFRLGRQLSFYNKSDPPPARVKPIPVPILLHTCTTARLSSHPASKLIADMITLGFFFLLRPGEYAYTANPESAPFRLQDIHLMVNNRRLNHLTCPDAHLDAATFIGLEFTRQKMVCAAKLLASEGPARRPFAQCKPSSIASVIFDNTMLLRTHHFPVTTIGTNGNRLPRAHSPLPFDKQ